jgi:hypothetical protein
LSQHGDTHQALIIRAGGLIATVGLMVQFACGPQSPRPVSDAERKAITDSLTHLVTNTYDFSRPDVVNRLMSLYPASGPVYSTASGHITTTRAELQQEIETFWKYVGSNMRNPKWEWTAMHVDVLAPDAAVMTASYRVPHQTPTGMNHNIAGAWTAVFVNRDGKWTVIQEHLSDVPAAVADSVNRAAMPGMNH